MMNDIPLSGEEYILACEIAGVRLCRICKSPLEDQWDQANVHNECYWNDAHLTFDTSLSKYRGPQRARTAGGGAGRKAERRNTPAISSGLN